MRLDRVNEEKNHGKATQLFQLSDVICNKLKDLNLKDSESTERKLKVTDNFSKMKDSSKNNFGDDVNKISDKFRDIKIDGEEHKKTEIVLNILCDNKLEDNKHKRDSNINFDEEQSVSNEERKISEVDVLKEEKVYGKLNSDSSSLIDNEKQKEVDETTEKESDASDVSKKTEENIQVLCSRGPVSQKICQQTFQPYNNWSCSRSHHSGGKVRVAEPTQQSQLSRPSMNGYHQPDILHFNVNPNDQEHYAPPVQNSFYPISEGPIFNINSLYAEQKTSFEFDEAEALFQEILQEHPRVTDYCKWIMSTNTEGGDEITHPSSPGDSGTSSVGSPAGSYQPPSVGSPAGSYQPPSVGSPAGSYQPPSVGAHDSGLDSPPHGAEYSWETLYDSDKTEFNTQYCTMGVSKLQNQSQLIQQTPFPQGMQQRSFPQCIQQRPFPQGQELLQENSFPRGRDIIQEQNKQILQEIPNIQGQQITQEKTNLQNLPIIQKKINIQGQQIIQENNIQGHNIIQENNIQGHQIIQEKTNVQGHQIIQENNIQGHQIIQEKTNMQGQKAVQENNIKGQQIIQENNLQGQQIIHNRTVCTSIVQERIIKPQICGESPTKAQGTKYRPILPKPELSSAKARFQQILDKDRRLLAWLKINEKLIADPKQLETQDAEGDTDLMIACCNKFETHLELIYAMVEKLRQNPNSLTIRNKQGHSALYLACKVLYDVPEVAAYIAETLVEHKVDFINMTYDGGLSLIQILEKEGDTHKKVLEGLRALKDSSGKNVFQPGNDVNANNFTDFNEPILLL